jgi:hypothetical protein
LEQLEIVIDMINRYRTGINNVNFENMVRNDEFFLELFKNKLILTFVIFVATKEGRTGNFVPPPPPPFGCCCWNRDPGWIKYPGSATLLGIRVGSWLGSWQTCPEERGLGQISPLSSFRRRKEHSPSSGVLSAPSNLSPRR